MYITIDDEKFKKAIDTTNRDMRKIARRAMARVGSKIKTDTKKNLRGNVLNKVDGELSRSIKYKANSDFSMVVSATAKHAAIHEFGGDILPKNGEYLSFEIDGNWIKTKEVHMPARPYLRPIIDDYFGGDKAEKIMEEVIDDALEQIFKENE